MNRYLLFVLVPLACVVAVFAAYFTYHSWYVIDVLDVQTNFRVVEPLRVGLDVNRSSALNFGSIPQGGGALRTIDLTSPLPSIATISTSDSLKGWVVLSQNPIRMEPGVMVRVNISIETPDDAPFGNYTGTTRIVYTRLLPWE